MCLRTRPSRGRSDARIVLILYSYECWQGIALETTLCATTEQRVSVFGRNLTAVGRRHVTFKHSRITELLEWHGFAAILDLGAVLSTRHTMDERGRLTPPTGTEGGRETDF